MRGWDVCDGRSYPVVVDIRRDVDRLWMSMGEG